MSAVITVMTFPSMIVALVIVTVLGTGMQNSQSRLPHWPERIARRATLTIAPHVMLFPALFIPLVILGLNPVG